MGVDEWELSVLILAGGGSERFGRDKALYEVLGEPLICQVVRRISPLSRNIIISAKSSSAEIARLFPNLEVVTDELELRAPIVGLMSSLSRVKTEYVAVVSCDSPLINPDVIRLLFRLARGRSGAVPIWPDGRMEPLQAVYRTKELLERLRDCWKRGDLRVRCAVESMEDTLLVPIETLREVDPELESFLNLNSREDLGDLMRRLKR